MNNPEIGYQSRKAQNLRISVARWAKLHRGSLLFVALPTLIAAIYYGIFAADLYSSEARFVVHAPSHMQLPGLSGFLQGTGLSRSGDDVYSVHDFILSRDAIAALQKHVDLRAVFGAREADFLTRYPNFLDSDNSEDFFRYYQRRVDVTFDTTTGISTLTVKAFRAEDAQKIAGLLLGVAEDVINRMNARARANTVRDAEAQVALAEDHVAEAERNVLAYRNREALLDPAKTSGAMFETLTKMQAQQSAQRLRLAELDRSLPDSPLRAELQQQIAVLDQQISRQRERLAGGNGSMAPKIAEYEQLSLRQEFAAKELTSALASLEAARAEARHQQIYLDRVVEANLPDKALYPKRFESVLVVLISCFLIYSISYLLIAGVREHGQD
jgi:capsular polysaccharide transport system permease protein